MKHLKTFENHNEENLDHLWNEIIEGYDVFQLFEVLLFKYGKGFLPDTEESIDEYDDDYNPDHIYDIIAYEMEQKDKFEEFVTNFDEYKIEKDENDPFHWRHQKKIQDELTKRFN